MIFLDIVISYRYDEMSSRLVAYKERIEELEIDRERLETEIHMLKESQELTKQYREADEETTATKTEQTIASLKVNIPVF